MEKAWRAHAVGGCVFQVTEGLHCLSPELCELTSGTLTLSVEVPEESAVK